VDNGRDIKKKGWEGKQENKVNGIKVMVPLEKIPIKKLKQVDGLFYVWN